MKRFSLLLVTFLLSCSVLAQETKLDTIEVSALASANNKPNYQVFSRQEIEGRFTSLANFLSQVNGIQIQQLSGLGNPALVSIRGASSQQTTVLVNGIDSSNAQYGGYDLNQISISQIESIEIIQDNSSGSETNQAIGGTINIITRQSHERSVNLQAGSFGTYQASLVQPLPANLGLELNLQQSDNDYGYPVPSPFLDSQNQFKKEKMNNAKFYRYSMQLAGGVDALSGRLQLSKKQKNIEDFQRNNPFNRAYLAEQAGVLELFGKQNLLDMKQRWHIGRSQQDEQFIDKEGFIGLGKDDNEYSYIKSYLSFSNQADYKQWQVDTGVKLYEDAFYSQHNLVANSDSCTSLQSACDAFSYQQSGTANLGIHWGNKKSDFFIHSQIYHQQINNLSRPRYSGKTAIKQDESFTGGSIALQWFMAGTEWNLGWKRAARIPTLYERYGNHGLMLGNRGLLSEVSQDISLDSKWQVTNSLTLSGAVFYRELENAIVPIYDSRGVGRYENTSEAHLTGLEWNALYQPNPWFIELSGSHYDSQTKSTVKSFNQKELAGTYHHSLQAKSGISWHKQQFDISSEYNEGLYLDRSNLAEGDSRFVVNISYRYKWQKTELGFSVNNLLNNQFSDFTNRPTMGRDWFIFLNTRF